VEEQKGEEQRQMAAVSVRKEKLEFKRGQMESSNGVTVNYEEEIY
jgi:hypothetical protein